LIFLEEGGEGTGEAVLPPGEVIYQVIAVEVLFLSIFELINSITKPFLLNPSFSTAGACSASGARLALGSLLGLSGYSPPRRVARAQSRFRSTMI
jgi:hypothetical protein